MIKEDQIIPTGKFFRTHALKGELNAMTDGYDPEIWEQGYPMIVEVEGIPVPFFVESLRPKGTQACLVKLKGIDSVERAAMFVNKTIFMLKRDVAEFLEVDEDEVMEAADYEGWKVYADDDKYLGRVRYIDSSNPNWLMMVEPESGGDDIIIPFEEDFIVSVEPDDEGSGKIVFDLPEGLVDLNKKE